jgi:hypothetical protein
MTTIHQYLYWTGRKKFNRQRALIYGMIVCLAFTLFALIGIIDNMP